MNDESDPNPPAVERSAMPRAMARPMPRLQQMLCTGLVLLVVSALVIPSRGAMSEAVALLLLLMAVLINAAAFGFMPGMISALVGLVIFNFFFVEPHFSLMAAQPQDVVVLMAFLGAAALTGILAGRLREEVDAAHDRADALEVLSAASGELARAQTPEAVLATTLSHVAALSGGAALALARGEEGLAVLARSGGRLGCSAVDFQAAEQALTRGRVELATAEGWTGSHLTFRPLPQGRAAQYALGHRPAVARGANLGYRDAAIASVLAQAEAALLRLELGRQAEDERRGRDRQTLRAALLASLSHDLRTPLATILGSVTTLRDLGAVLPAAAQTDLLDAAAEEAERLARYVEKLLQMTRLVSGGSPSLAVVDAAEAALSAAARARRSFPQAQIDTALPELPLVEAEPGLVEQVIFNLIENAVRYGHPPAAAAAVPRGPVKALAPVRVMLRGHADQLAVTLEVVDHGPGLPERLKHWLASGELTAMPEDLQAPLRGPAARAAGGERGPGTGLGLPICKGIAHLLGGRLELRQDQAAAGGTVIALILPVRHADKMDEL